MISMPREAKYEHAKACMKLQGWVPTSVKNRPFYPEAGTNEVYGQGKELRRPKFGDWASWTLRGLITRMKTAVWS